MATVTTSQRTALTRAIVRRFGASMLPLRFTSTGTHTVRVTDDESGSWVEGDFSRTRMRVTAEHDGAAPVAQPAAAPTVPQPVQPAQARALRPQGTRLTRVNDNVPAFIQPGSARAHPAAAQAVRKAYNGHGNIMTPDVLGFATLGGTFAAELSEGESFRDRATGIAPAIFGVSVVSLRTARPDHRLSRVFTSRDSACLYMGKVHHLGTYRTRRRALLNARRHARREIMACEARGDALGVLDFAPQARAALVELRELRAEYRVTLARFGCEAVEPGDDAPAEHMPTVGDVHAASRPDYLA